MDSPFNELTMIPRVGTLANPPLHGDLQEMIAVWIFDGGRDYYIFPTQVDH